MLGELLVQRGAITKERLEEMLRLKAEEAIFDLFTWNSGQFSFLDGDLPGYELVPISLDVQGLVLEGMRRLDEWERILEVIPSGLCVPVTVLPMESGNGGEPGRRSVIEAVDDDRSIEDICLHTHSSEFFVCDILYHEVQAGRVKIVRPRIAARRLEPDTGMSGEALLKLAEEQLEAGELERAVRHLQAAASLEPNDRRLREHISGVMGKVCSRFADGGLLPSCIPALTIDVAELGKLDLEPSEGFILSRIDGVSAVEAIVKISPLAEIDALLVIWKLYQGGQIRLG
jgi:hypothetical protein